MPEFVFNSLMEAKAREFPSLYTAEEPALPGDELTTRTHIRELGRQLVILSKHLKWARKALRAQEKQFQSLANYKYKLEKTLVTPTLYTLNARTKKKDKVGELLKKLEALTPEQLRKLEEIKL